MTKGEKNKPELIVVGEVRDPEAIKKMLEAVAEASKFGKPSTPVDSGYGMGTSPKEDKNR
jgi:hypothetical protein